MLNTMVIRGDIGTAIGITIPVNDCYWITGPDPDENGYLISEAHYVHGVSQNIGGVTGVTHEIDNPVLGYIGKSGRFVPISN